MEDFEVNPLQISVLLFGGAHFNLLYVHHVAVHSADMITSYKQVHVASLATCRSPPHLDWILFGTLHFDMEMSD